MPYLDLVFRVYQWLVTLDAKKIVIFLFSLVVTILIYENYTLRNNNERLTGRVDTNADRCDSIKAVLEERLQGCNDEKFKMVQETSVFWAKKVAELEERMYKDYQPVKNTKNK